MQGQIVHCIPRNVDTSWIRLVIETRLDAQPLGRSRAADKRDNRLESSERSAAPVSRDVTEETMLNLVPLACSWRKMADMNIQGKFVRQTL